MVDPLSLSTAAAAAEEIEKVAGGLITRLLGPSVDLVGQHWAMAVKNRYSNARRVAELADARTRGPGAIPARVADGVLQSAQFAESEFVAEYLSGILASSRTTEGRDDSGVSWTSLISQLSSDQLRLHYTLYTAARSTIIDKVEGTTDSAMCRVVCLLSFDDVRAAMDWGPEDYYSKFRESVYGLQRQNLIGTVSHGSKSFLQKLYPQYDIPESGGLVYRARIPGLLLYLWGFGEGGASATILLNRDFDIIPIGFDLPTTPTATYMGINHASSGFGAG